jgi:hypothetical protein
MRSSNFASVVFLIHVVCIFSLISAWTDATYRAGVVEYMPVVSSRLNVTRDQALSIMHRNVDAYEEFIAEAKSDGVDILVFPEYGLYGPNFATRDSVYPYLERIPNGGANPCTEIDLYPYLNITHRYVSRKRSH